MARPEQGPLPYQRVSRFTGEQPAGIAYSQAQQVIYEAKDTDLSVFRLQLNTFWHVAALGAVPPAPVLTAIERILDMGEPAELPTEVWQLLWERRRQATRQGSWHERHYRPGRHI